MSSTLAPDHVKDFACNENFGPRNDPLIRRDTLILSGHDLRERERDYLAVAEGIYARVGKGRRVRIWESVDFLSALSLLERTEPWRMWLTDSRQGIA